MFVHGIGTHIFLFSYFCISFFCSYSFFFPFPFISPSDVLFFATHCYMSSISSPSPFAIHLFLSQCLSFFHSTHLPFPLPPYNPISFPFSTPSLSTISTPLIHFPFFHYPTINLTIIQQQHNNTTLHHTTTTGIGFAHYMGLISAFPRDVDVYLVEWPHVAMQMSDRVSKLPTSNNPDFVSISISF